MADGRTIFRFLDKLVEQTELKNIQWNATNVPHEYEFRGASGLVRLASVDRDGVYPIRLSIFNTDGLKTSAWDVNEVSDGDDEAFDSRVRRLWAMVNTAKDPLVSLLQELEDLPPF